MTALVPKSDFSDPKCYRVWSENPESDYVGPVAEVSQNGEWLWVITDHYEGAAMLNIETLPVLIEALQMIMASRSQPVA